MGYPRSHRGQFQPSTHSDKLSAVGLISCWWKTMAVPHAPRGVARRVARHLLWQALSNEANLVIIARIALLDPLTKLPRRDRMPIGGM